MRKFSLYLLLVRLCLKTLIVKTIVLQPNFSTISIMPSVSIPIQELQTEYRTLFDWCFQISYDLPSNLSTFYNVPIWSNKLDRSKRYNLLDYDKKEIGLKVFKYQSTKGQHFNDFSAGELYQALEDFLISLGFHDTCLMQAVCSLARHPFGDQQTNIVTNILTFVLSPSLHKGFNDQEHLYKELYETAELYGFLNEDCHKIYGDCHHNFLNAITKVVLN